MKRMTKLDAFESLLRHEINWCKRNKRIGVTGDDFKAGFVAGLHQAAKLLGDAKRGPRSSNPVVRGATESRTSPPRCSHLNQEPT